MKSRIYRRRKAGLPDDPNMPMPPLRQLLTPEERKERDRARWRRRWEKQKKDRIEQERAKRAAEVEQAILLGMNTLGFPRTVAAWSWATKQLERGV